MHAHPYKQNRGKDAEKDNQRESQRQRQTDR